MRTFVRTLIVIGSAAIAAPLGTARAQDPGTQTDQSDPAAPQPPSSRATPKAPAQTQGTGQSESGDFAQVIDQALSGIDLRSDQKDTLQKVGADVDMKVSSVDMARRDLLRALADEVEAGKVDPSSLKDKEQKVVDAATAASPTVRSALEKVHDTLDSAQRKQFVSAIRDSMKKRHTDAKSRVEGWAKKLNLTDDQKTKIGAIFSGDSVAIDVARARIELVLAAFPGDKFSMDDLLPAKSVADNTRELEDRIIDETGKVTDVLTPDQRKTAAQGIRDRAAGKSEKTGTTGSSEELDSEQVGSTSQAL
jgi:Spy/CpxP family protein refolding chaperone